MYQVGPEPIAQGIALLPLIENGTLNKGTLRQGFKVQFWRNGAIYIFRIGNSGVGPLLLNEPIIGYEMPWHQSINIDTYQDLEVAELIAPKFISGLS
jgi:CMP-N-acetylneuraminic acid synthetase